MEIRNAQWGPREVEILNRNLLLTSKPMVYLLNLSKLDYLSGNLPNRA
jgi:obg-like ATPase 1